MTKAIVRKRIVVVGLTLTMILGAWVDPTPTAAAQEPITLEIVPTAVASVTEARAVQEGEYLVVSGIVWKQQEFFLPGHVDIVVRDPDGNRVALETPRVTGSTSKRGGVKEARFTARRKLTIPAGSTVRVRYHAPASRDEHL